MRCPITPNRPIFRIEVTLNCSFLYHYQIPCLFRGKAAHRSVFSQGFVALFLALQNRLLGTVQSRRLQYSMPKDIAQCHFKGHGWEAVLDTMLEKSRKQVRGRSQQLRPSSKTLRFPHPLHPRQLYM